ncbi:MAG: signal peptidase I [Muribaculaceae bacterium]|nr:signal peptidase I [Muribaculaceae bacterium]
MKKRLNKEYIKKQIKQTRLTRWIRFGVVSLIFFAWVIWMGNWWLSIFIFLLFDIYITGIIPFDWWRNSKNKLVRGVMSWVDAIVYALILVYFVFAFVGQNYQIPTSSLEKTLLTGDYLWVNKMVYGPRVPMTPVHFPLVHNTLPFINTKSYLDSPSLEYRRLKGLRNVELGDIVVFNFPAGDTVPLMVQNPDYYTLVKMVGREQIKNNPKQFGEIVYRPVDRRENYVKRCVGLPGQKFQIKNGVIYIDGKAQKQPENVQFNYFVQTKSPLSNLEWDNLGIAEEDRGFINLEKSYDIKLILEDAKFDLNQSNNFYMLPLTNEMIQKLNESGNVVKIAKANDTQYAREEYIFPDVASEGWTSYNYGGEKGLIIPKKGMTIDLTEDNWNRYNRCIRNYEHNYDAYFKDGKVYIGGKPTDKYTFKMDYYFMMGDNRDNSLDSRFWGFVPEDHIVGTPMFVLISFDKDKNLFNGGIRWNRIFKDANPDK